MLMHAFEAKDRPRSIRVRSADAKGLALRVDVPDSTLKTDGGKLRQILLNLLSNAVNHLIPGTSTWGSVR